MREVSRLRLRIGDKSAAPIVGGIGSTCASDGGDVEPLELGVEQSDLMAADPPQLVGREPLLLVEANTAAAR